MPATCVPQPPFPGSYVALKPSWLFVSSFWLNHKNDDTTSLMSSSYQALPRPGRGPPQPLPRPPHAPGIPEQPPSQLQKLL